MSFPCSRSLTCNSFPLLWHVVYQQNKAKNLSQTSKVAIGTFTLLGFCAVPIFAKPNEKRGHDLFSQERPEAVLDSQEKALKEFDRKSKEARKVSSSQ